MVSGVLYGKGLLFNMWIYQSSKLSYDMVFNMNGGKGFWVYPVQYIVDSDHGKGRLRLWTLFS